MVVISAVLQISDAHSRVSWHRQPYDACRPCTLDNSVRQLTLAVHDPVDYMSGMRMVPKAVEPRWLDNYQYPGQKVELTTNQGTPVPVVICSSPSEARNESGVGNFSMIDVLVEKYGDSADVFAADIDETFEISRIHGPGFSNPVNDDINLTSVLEVWRPCCSVPALSPTVDSGVHMRLGCLFVFWNLLQCCLTCQRTA